MKLAPPEVASTGARAVVVDPAAGAEMTAIPVGGGGGGGGGGGAGGAGGAGITATPPPPPPHADKLVARPIKQADVQLRSSLMAIPFGGAHVTHVSASVIGRQKPAPVLVSRDDLWVMDCR